MIKVLLVDDSAIIRKAIKTTLSKNSEIQVIGECKDGKEVIPFLQHHQPHVILMDYSMPILDGIETTRQVNHLFFGIKIIGLSCNDDVAIKNAFFENGAVEFLSKYEINNDILTLKINNCCLIV